ncbi:MAG: hypothetical protein IPN29_06590 [Saprospiraceae bacterium]|nr:hypothetical protein [Saprospiraceae bacterium]
MDQSIPGSKQTYWQKMMGIFDRAEEMRVRGIGEADIEIATLRGLDTLRSLIKTMPFLPEFRQELEQQFLTIFDKPMGSIPVFIRSDTNMEDLKDFSGAGLNLTVFNVLNAEKIWEGIRNVWASPYAERSYKWRQRYLYNPENVYPSILIIPSVNADKSGVIVTKGIISGNEADITAAFNRGVGGAVDGQAAESWLLSENGDNRLTMPARELSYLSIPATGGSLRLQTSLENPILEEEDMAAIRQLTARILKELPETPGINTPGPFDMELGFKDHKMWLFQVRPFVENKQATASEYLEKISPVYDGQRLVQLDQKI